MISQEQNDVGVNHYENITSEVKNLLTNANGLLYQDEQGQILYKSEY